MHLWACQGRGVHGHHVSQSRVPGPLLKIPSGWNGSGEMSRASLSEGSGFSCPGAEAPKEVEDFTLLSPPVILTPAGLTVGKMTPGYKQARCPGLRSQKGSLNQKTWGHAALPPEDLTRLWSASGRIPLHQVSFWCPYPAVLINALIRCRIF